MTIPLKAALKALANRDGEQGQSVRCSSVGVLLLNAGVIHRVGPHRVNVKLARQLAETGIPSVRVDLSGLGDSRRAAGTEPMLAQVAQDVRSALDALSAQAGVKHFVIVGICSGAEYGYQYAAQDPRVAGLVMVDGYSFGNWRTKWLRYGLRLSTLTWPVFRNAVQGRIRRFREQRAGAGGAGANARAPVDYGLPSITAETFAAGLSERIRSGCQVYLIYTGSILQRYNHASQFRDVMATLPLSASDREALSRVRCDFLPQIDHTLSTLDGQRLFIGRVCKWLVKRVQTVRA
ncbi:MAG: alpha/beta fold hydrolase [Lautropia sp.]|nr:alpha/beta fold hydrolase [Lautropia sp.]